MDIRKITLSGVLFAAGLIIHQLMPPIFGVTPDVQLAVLFIVILINGSFKSTIAAGIVSGIITSLTTKFPGGQVPNFVEKIITSIIMYFVIVFILKFANKIITMAIVGLLGTILSGFIFLTLALYIVGLPSGLTVNIGIISVVLPAAVINLFLTPVLYKIVEKSSKAV
ncbi:tryptophan transporter [Clostridium cylindrosporum]|uniref:Putative tryptophan transport protein TrpP n=1 Tax=Clostridium cylindrosporum DSM 605 TaxID=1121307 RepID=A0A0J8D5X6_CLOCY|nr:tryptophan transporter [Clostridium cylindrosporum]KMT21262.1 putative tryptophan transport protein TrpP [Clostridium cylindrosporum DSM 605]